MSQFIKAETRVQRLDFDKAWEFLTETERNYAYYMSKASWAGAKMVFHQISYEAPPLFLLFQAYFCEKDFQALEESALASGATAEEWVEFIAYVAGFYGNFSNYHNFGHNKFAPTISEQKFYAILASNPLMNDASHPYRSTLAEIWPLVSVEVFALEKPFTQLNFPHKGGVTGYFSRNLDGDELDLILEFLQSEKIDVLNTRAFKNEDGSITITVGSIETEGSRAVEFKGIKFKIAFGEFAPYLEEMNYYLERAKNYAANDNQREMIEKYIESYRTGSIDAHKDSQRKWIADKGPIVETNMGWIETYIDPTNQRAYFEGWVAVVDKEKSKKFKSLVENSEHIIPKLPWNDLGMEKDNFLAPDFTTLDIVSFATNGCPLGINIPNYDDIRENEGFKNVFLNNSMGSYVPTAVQFATAEQAKLLSDNVTKCYEVHVACHELLGHGTGKLIFRTEGQPTPTFTDPDRGDTFESCYEVGEVWNTKFGAISTSFEECRADTCGFFLCTLPEVYTLFGIEEHEVDTMLWVNVMQQFRKGIAGLNLFNAETGKWGQAHTQGAYVFAQYLLQNQKTELCSLELTENGTDFLIHLNKENLMGEGRELIRQFLLILQTYKSSGCIERAAAWYAHYSKVEGELLKIREIVIANKVPRRLELYSRLERYNAKNILPINYHECFEGIILSFAERYPFTAELRDQTLSQWRPTAEQLRVKKEGLPENIGAELQNIGRHFPAVPAGKENAPIRITITGAAGQIGGFLCSFVAQGRMFGPYQKVILQLLEIPPAEKVLQGLVMELNDGAYECLHEIIPTTDPEVAFRDTDVALLVGAIPRGPGMERSDLLAKNKGIFEAQGKALNQFAKKTVKVCVTGNPANTNCLIASTFAPDIPKENFTALTRLDQNRAYSQIAEKAGCSVNDLDNIYIWGNHSSTQYPDVSHAKVKGQAARGALADDEWVNGEFVSKVQKRGAEIISVMGKSSAASAANAICDHMHDWWFGTRPGKFVSMGVTSDGNTYGVPEGLIYSFPLRIENGKWKIVEGLEIDAFSRDKLDKTGAELIEEKAEALG